MPKTIKKADHRKVVLKMTIEISVTLCKAYFYGDRPADRFNDMLICAAIVVGQAEGHPLNASKISEWVAMARPTVLRRLADLERRGFVERKGRVFVMPADMVNSAPGLAACDAAQRMIISACAQLSKLDTKGIASR